jgi:putative endonuclease
VDGFPIRHLSGRRAEAAVAALLEREGFVVLWRNLRLGALEIDVVAQRGDLVVAVEVRTRGAGAWENALASVAGKKKMYLLRAVERLWRKHLAARRDVARVRIDVACVRFERGAAQIDYFPGAITA